LATTQLAKGRMARNAPLQNDTPTDLHKSQLIGRREINFIKIQYRKRWSKIEFIFHPKLKF